MIQKRKNAGFTLIELMIVVAIIAIIASVAIPKLLSARLSANESAAISTLRSLSSAQAQVQSSAAIDTDGDGAGEFGYFAELAGAQPLRIAAGAPPAPAAGVAGVDNLNPSVLSTAFGAVNPNGAGLGVVTRSGYVFQIWLPAVVAGGLVPGIAEDGAGGKLGAPFPGPDEGEVLWACYAWPLQVAQTGNRAFFINEEGDLLQTQNRGGAAYTTVDAGPNFDACYSVATDMSSPLGVNGVPAVDGNVWTPVQ